MAIAGETAILALVRALYPEITTGLVPDVWLSAWAPWAATVVGPEWSTAQPTGIALLLAHRALRSPAMSGAGASTAPGPVASIGTGALSQSWGSWQGSITRPGDAELMTTDAGRAFVQLRSTIPAYVAPCVL